MSTAHLSLDDYAFPGNKPHSSYELSYALGAPPASSLYPHAGLEAQSSGSHTQTRFHPHHSGGAHPTYLPDHPEAYLEQYYLGMGSMGYPQFQGLTPPYPMAHHPPSPRTVYAANSGWEAAEGYGAPLDSTASSPSSFLHSLQNVIDSSHTSQVQQQTSGQAQLAPAQLPPPSPPSWTLSGSLDPATGVFQRSVEHPRLRTAQACEKCRTRKAKCSGDHPTCQRCLSRGLQCEYAPERKMRGPNKQKRKSVSQKPTDTPPSSGRRSSIVSVASTASSSSDASALDAHAAAAAAAVAAVNGTRPSSRASLHRGMQASPRRAAPRPRSSTIALGAIKRAAEYAPPSALHRQHGTGTPPLRQRPPPLDLSGVRQFAQHPPNMLAQYTRGGEPVGAYGPPPAPGFAGAAEARSPSLPPYLLDAYSRIAFADAAAVSAQDALFGGPSAATAAAAAAFVAAESSGMARMAADPYMHSAGYTTTAEDLDMDMDMSAYLEGSPADALSLYSHPRSTSSDVSTPITPLSLSDRGSVFGPGEQLGLAAFPAAGYGAAAFALGHCAGDGDGAGADAYAAVDALGLAERSFGAPEGAVAIMQAFGGGGMEDAFRPKSAPEVLGAGWDVVMDDETPRADGDGGRKLSHAGGQLVADAAVADAVRGASEEAS